MTYRKLVALSGLALVLSALPLCSFSSAQEIQSASLDEQLKTYYKLVTVDPYGVTVPGTVLTVVKKNVMLMAPGVKVCPQKVEKDKVKSPTFSCSWKIAGKWNFRVMDVGEEVYPAKIDIDQDKDTVTVQIIERNGATVASSFRGELVIPFAKGSMKTAGVPQVATAITQVLAIDQTADDARKSQTPQGFVSQSSAPAPTNLVAVPQIQTPVPMPPPEPTVPSPVAVRQGRAAYQIQADIERQQRDIAQAEHSLSLMGNPVARTGMQSLLARQRARLRDLQLEFARATH